MTLRIHRLENGTNEELTATDPVFPGDKVRAWEIANMPLPEDIDFSVFEGLNLIAWRLACGHRAVA